MGKFVTILALLVLVGLSGYLYEQVVSLQKTNLALKEQIAAMSRARSEIVPPLSRAGRHLQGAVPILSPSAWLAVAKTHMLLADAAMGKKDFSEAERQAAFANLALSRAAAGAGASTVTGIQQVRDRIHAVQVRANALWHAFGG